MKRIAGILNLDHTPVHAVEIDRMLGALNHAKHEEWENWVHGGIGLGCTHSQRGTRSLREDDKGLPLNQPYVIVFDGRIDNRPELLAILRSQLPAGQAQYSDEALVLAAYEKWGALCPQFLIGGFAFAIWDRKERRLICARDHFGVKPFYYYRSMTSFLFGSAPEALLACGKIPLQIHGERIADFLVNPLEGADQTSSFYENVFRLPPAHLLIVDAGGITLHRYWELRPGFAARPSNDEECLEAFQELFTEAIRCRLQELAIPASMLSGGMDSSAIVGVGRKLLLEEGKCLHAFAVISNDAQTNRESAHISSVLGQGNLQPHLISQTELLPRMDELVSALEAESEPFDCLMNLNRAVYLHARDQNITALLDGVDGDVLLSGSGHLAQLCRQAAYRTLLEETWRADGLTAEYRLGKRLLFESLLSMATQFAPDWLRKLRRHYRSQKVVETSIRDSIIAPEFALCAHLEDRFASLDSHSPRPPSFMQQQFHRIALNHPFLTVGLERYERVASAFGIEARHPFTDVRLAEFCLNLPWHLKTRRGWTKLILRRALEPHLPAEVVWRKDKDSLMWEVNRLILKARAEYFYQITLDEEANLKPYVDTAKLMEFWQEYLVHGEETHAELIWSGIALALWLRRHRNMQVGWRETTL